MKPQQGPPHTVASQLLAFFSLLFNLGPVVPLPCAVWPGYAGVEVGMWASRMLGFHPVLQEKAGRGMGKGWAGVRRAVGGGTLCTGCPAGRWRWKLRRRRWPCAQPWGRRRSESGGGEERDLSVWYLHIGGERAASRFPAITKHICYCRFINEACGSEDWFVHCVNWIVG